MQLWGPRFSDCVVAARDLAVFSLGRLPDDDRSRARAHDTAKRLHAFLDGRRMPSGKAGHAMGVQPNCLRYAAQTGTVLLRWDGASQPVVWTVPAPDADPRRARLELARRHLHVFGPGTAESFARWPGAVFVHGEIVGTWRRSAGAVAITAWRRLTRPERDGVEAEAASLPLPGLEDAIAVCWV